MSSPLTKNEEHCGYVAICGRPNVGKSTLLNAILRQKISITSSKPQTTRHKILGVKTRGTQQALYVDTPGLHRRTKRSLNRRMNRQAYAALDDNVDVILLVIEALCWQADDEWILDRLKAANRPIILLINKIDTVKKKEMLLPFLDKLQKKHAFASIIPLCARSPKKIEVVETEVENYLPPRMHCFEKDTLTDCSEKFLVSEIIREKLMRRLYHEVPYSLMVEIEILKVEEGKCQISAIIWVETAGQKAILIGKGGEQLKQVGQQARLDIEKLLAKKTHLSLWVKIKEGWPDNPSMLTRQGL